jgi:hypothetical protein
MLSSSNPRRVPLSCADGLVADVARPVIPAVGNRPYCGRSSANSDAYSCDFQITVFCCGTAFYLFISFRLFWMFCVCSVTSLTVTTHAACRRHCNVSHNSVPVQTSVHCTRQPQLCASTNFSALLPFLSFQHVSLHGWHVIVKQESAASCVDYFKLTWQLAKPTVRPIKRATATVR